MVSGWTDEQVHNTLCAVLVVLCVILFMCWNKHDGKNGSCGCAESSEGFGASDAERAAWFRARRRNVVAERERVLKAGI